MRQRLALAALLLLCAAAAVLGLVRMAWAILTAPPRLSVLHFFQPCCPFLHLAGRRRDGAFPWSPSTGPGRTVGPSARVTGPDRTIFGLAGLHRTM